MDDAAVDALGGEIADELAGMLGARLIKNEIHPDLIDVSRSLHHRQLFGSAVKNWSPEKRQRLVDLAYHPYRDRVQSEIAKILNQFTFAIHLSVRTFDLIDGGKRVRTDVGLLYDPARSDEQDLCVDWIDELYYEFPNLRVRRNYPRRGTVDSLTKWMRGQFPPAQYLGIEVWFNRAWAARRVRLRDEALRYFVEALRETIGMTGIEAA